MTQARLIDDLAAVYREHAAPGQAAAMRAYMRDQFEFLGLPSPLRRQLARPFLTAPGDPLEVAQACWELPEREFQYFACDLLTRHAKTLTPAALPTLRTLITTKSWWDTVDALAANVVGPVVSGDQTPMDAWAADDDLWVARTAILHQLRYRAATDAERLFAYCTRWRHEQDFFIRKGIGWALREYAKTDPAAVRRYVADHPDLSGLSQREALKNIGRDGEQPSA
ncbi:DNA alkylation repair protein [Dactylosporangium sp. NPDC049525]|uniref:DNA alkylation repair protein n=1 Tax=Dactylosporangium sp. NPDC049525 TaxID=3154730 RepID=UPI003443307E